MRALTLAVAVLFALPALAAGPTAQNPYAHKPAKDAVRHVPLEALFNGAPGVIDKGEVAYADLNGDGIEEAIVPLSSEGSAADVAIAVYGFDEVGLLRPLLLHQGQHLLFKVSGKKLVITEPVYGPDDPNCCPSGTSVMTYAWNGRALVLESKKAGPAPQPQQPKP